MAFIQIPIEIITVGNLTNAEKVLAAALIYFQWKETNITYIGSYKLAEFLNTSRAAITRGLKDLESKKYIIINQRKNGSKSNEILLTFERGIEFALGGVQAPPKGTQIESPEGNQFDTPEGNQIGTMGNQSDTPGTQIDSPHKDIIFKYQDLNLNTRETETQFDTPRVHPKYIEPADGTAGRSISDGDAIDSVENSATDVGAAAAQTELEDYCLVSAFFEVFKELAAWVYLSRVGGYIAIQGIGKIGERKLDEVREKVAGWFEIRRVKLAFLPANEKNKGIILNREAA